MAYYAYKQVRELRPDGKLVHTEQPTRKSRKSK